ncbi:hypothetical protein GLAREA_06353 [Glarea lozoyensis ATCC 20868]|uniref:DUF7708 domain-containing protein n=1 Tax=Glarea lozoyensis (strain ATCC 20868 / MF5171) TaxID=1116229 RepID=S3DMP0_GLAL2|nr:uncharacterized protein GLAREA_06353 [Glarea lozoyensis ATCC 20868]EPE33341.1 hypothetical protein GLAREA_06353 [Glarea lozoyensis ATCC 20868]
MSVAPEAGQLVRSFSLEVENQLRPEVPVNDLRRVFVRNERRLQKEEEEREDWRSYYEPWKPVDADTNPTTIVLREKAVLLSHAWKVFRITLPKNEQEALEGTVPSVQGLIGMVESTSKRWQDKRMTSKSGKFMKHFTGFCGTLDSHSYMLEVLPGGNEYVSLFTGVLKTVVNASANHEKIASSFGEALLRISVHIEACEREVRLHRTKSMQEKIVKLYAHVFLYLEDTMEWYQKRSRTHFREAFRQNFNDKFESTIVNIQNLSLDVLREANVSSMAETRQIRLTAEETLDELKFGQMDARLSLDSVARKLAEMEYQNKQLRLELRREAEERQQLELNKTMRLEEFRNSLVSQIGTGMRHELERVAQNMVNDGIWDVRGQTRRTVNFINSSASHTMAAQTYQRQDVILGSNHLLNFFSEGSLEKPYSPPYNVLNLDQNASSRLKEWTTDSKINLLAVAGRRPHGHEPPPMAMLASMCIEYAVAAKLPVISYFCCLPQNDDLREGNTKEVQGLLSLIYAMIRQLINQLPAQFSSELNLSSQRFADLQGSLASWGVAISLLKDLVDIVPRPLFCIIDGLQLLDDWSTETLLEEFIAVLKEGSSSGGDTEGLKILLTTTGRSRALVKCLEARNLVLADRDGAADGSARRAGNRRFLF